MIAYQDHGSVKFKNEPASEPSPLWHYSIDPENNIRLIPAH